MKNRKKNPNLFPKKKNWRQKIEICKSSETRVAEVSQRSERSSRGKRTFEVRRHLGGMRGAQKNARGSLPQRGWTWSFLEVLRRRPYREGFARPVEGADGPSTGYCPSFKNSSWAPSWLQVRICSQLVCIFRARCFEVAFFIVSRWFWDGFWEVWRRFWGCFGGCFSHDFKKIEFCKK